jgi:chlorobactene glucosyltransferase
MVLWISIATLMLWSLLGAQSIVNILTAPRLRREDPPADQPFLVSIVIPARNEERSIRATVEAMLAQTWRSLEVIVVDDQSEDDTGRIVAEIARGDSRVKLVKGVDRPEGWLGKPWALEQGGRAASGEWILFVDADIDYRPSTIASLMAEIGRHPGFDMLFVMPKVVAKSFWENVVMPGLSCGLYLSVPILLSNRGGAVLLAVGGGTGNLVRAHAWRSIGGHERLRNAVVDDIGLARMLRRFGHRTRMVRAEEFASVRMYHGLGEIILGFTKNAYSVFAGSPVRAVFTAALAAVVHLVPWIVGIGGLFGGFDGRETAFALGTLGLIVLTRVFLYATLGFSLLAAVLLHPLEILITLYIFARSTLVVGILRSVTWRGRGYPARITTFGEVD